MSILINFYPLKKIMGSTENNEEDHKGKHVYMYGKKYLIYGHPQVPLF